MIIFLLVTLTGAEETGLQSQPARNQIVQRGFHETIGQGAHSNRDREPHYERLFILIRWYDDELCRDAKGLDCRPRPL
jgi:hypothetical protein